MIVVVGIGADGMAGLAEASRAELRRATVIYGSQRQLDLLDDTVPARRREWPSPMLPALKALPVDDDIHVVASGDPLLHGIGGTLIRLHGPEKVRVLPHVSSVTLACARMGWNVHDTEVISLVTAQPHTAVRRGGKAIVLSQGKSTPTELAALLNAHGRGDSQLTVLERLGGPDEHRRDGTARDWAGGAPGHVDDLNVIAVRYLPDERVSPIPDDAFTHDGQITKQGIRAVTLAALAPRPGERLWDVGAASGSIGVEWCLSGPGCGAIAFERDEQRRHNLERNAAAFGVGIEVRGDAPEAFDGAAPPSAIFIGGGLTQPGLLDACLDHLPAGGRLVANVVTTESEAAVTQAYTRLGGELRRFQHYQGKALGAFTGWQPHYPVTQWVMTK
ncbi:bifunctional cobalt-precorrin-7 (C(5))-methyltransferase/cobalt-precorrin-6B (C(15))-methyltransferase [Mycobacterium intracellulare]|uniref:Precorrin-6Y C5,15-methyltransferase (Decarboxylating), CbiT subunit n=1 Tax=Mycobacterium intracellulare 1956 TaxID=1299331 RepID=X8CT71_MYCIT|nr:MULTISPECIES: bifunctional cobalt-precorrin-7 (C(5))-methyltransferase/cobalt-precorrin-6B (C(15))-methyltransferase [Mycobacterium]EUA59239.1 precorrin-6Y C5,15-methyltransferase (decarboxylating), CbiT subunit [Mycobacterium intracellulare 1956]EUA27248.1 precorrin-6Y C5,15-methyltransferase (decarboxylating), CbiT subunit [Mycobacterium intracellulare]MCA2254725.1 bifunctional cobalt-precorrin-7 (C(5))-methyltransferase/cobalt-precorrin-6B (C(15))-methyltransferase [Mycobacterium intracell